ncbi:MAG: hypothetical protein HYS81_03890 [Candidatus Aenigmatarchaeota archaeon]|nr:MAG: hypothetical protein HYS81_03890 [Candidatus Aenigmarchaeota archaeon]
MAATSSRESVDNLFRTYLGPMAIVVLPDLEKKGLTKERVLSYIDDLQKKGVLGADSAVKFKREIEAVFA